MCRKCIINMQPDRGETTLESGFYILNFNGCAECGKKSMGKATNKKTEEEENGNKETITFTHVCAECGHEICKHTYNFEIEDGYQEYSMECWLCGWGQASKSIEPEDPREMAKYEIY